MTLATTQSDFRNHMKHYLDMVNDSSEVVYIARSNQRAAAVIDQDKLDWLERHAKANPESLEYAVAENKLKEYGIFQIRIQSLEAKIMINSGSSLSNAKANI